MQATARKIDDRHLEKLNQIKENIKAQSLSIGPKACIDMIKELDAEILLQIHAVQLSKAAIFLLVPLRKKEKTDCYDTLIKHLLGEERGNLETVTEFMNARITDDDNQDKFKNGVLHELIINECWNETVELIEACANNGIEINGGITRGDVNGRRPLEIALMMDVAPVEVLKVLTTLHQQAMADTVENRVDLFNILSIAYKQQNSDFLHWLGTENLGLYEGLMNHIDESGVRVHREDEYVAVLRSVCVWAGRSVHADSNYLLLDVDGSDICFLRRDDDQIMVVAKDTGSRKNASVTTQKEMWFNILSWLGAKELPWDPLVCKSGSEVLASTEENMKLLFFLMTPDNQSSNFQLDVIQGLVNKLQAYIGKENFRRCLQMGADLAGRNEDPTLECIRGVGIRSGHSLLSSFSERRASSIPDGKQGGRQNTHILDKQCLKVDQESGGAESIGAVGLFSQRGQSDEPGMAAVTEKKKLSAQDEAQQMMMFEAGDCVELVNLKNRQDLNGTIGSVQKKASGKRYTLKIKNKNGQESFIRVLPANMKKLQVLQVMPG